MARVSVPKLNFILDKRSTAALIVSAICIILLGQFTNIDLAIEDYYFDANTHQFVWYNAWFAKDFMHGAVKYVITVAGCLLWLIVFLDLIYPWSLMRDWLRLRLRFVALVALIIPTIGAIGKHFSTLHCPYDLTRYGGYAPFVRLLDAMPNDIKAGHCFPAGHATVALWLAALCVFWLPHKPRTALAVFFAGLSLGLALGWVQQMRGAHFLFHTLWSLWMTALVIVVLLGFSKAFHLENAKL